MISKNRIKLIHSLEKKKFRRQEGLFVAEGPKLVGELMPAFTLRYLAATAQWLSQHRNQVGKDAECDTVSEEELRKASLQQHPQEVIALFGTPSYEVSLPEIAAQELTLALDGVQDPGNLGTIVRLADWFGIRHIFCSPDTADIFNPKAIQATMGAIARVQVHYIDLARELSSLPPEGEMEGAGAIPVYGTFLDGDNIYNRPLTRHGIIIMGNEGNGISTGVSRLVSSRLRIPSYPPERETVESLNVAIATAIVCAEFRRRA